MLFSYYPINTLILANYVSCIIVRETSTKYVTTWPVAKSGEVLCAALSKLLNAPAEAYLAAFLFAKKCCSHFSY